MLLDHRFAVALPADIIFLVRAEPVTVISGPETALSTLLLLATSLPVSPKSLLVRFSRVIALEATLP